MTYHILCTFLLTEEYRAQEVRWSNCILRNGFDTTVVVCLVAADVFFVWRLEDQGLYAFPYYLRRFFAKTYFTEKFAV